MIACGINIELYSSVCVNVCTGWSVMSNVKQLNRFIRYGYEIEINKRIIKSAAFTHTTLCQILFYFKTNIMKCNIF